MNDTAVTLRDLVLPSGNERSPTVRLGFEGSTPVRELKEKLAKQTAVDWSGVSDVLLEKMGEMLDVGLVGDVLVKVWNQAQLFRRYLDRDRYPSNETIAVPLAEHTITSTHHPHLEVRLNEVLARSIRFDVTLHITLKGVILEIRDAKIRKVRTGEYSGKAELACEGALLVSRELESKHLPGEVVFANGVPIAP